MRSGAHRVGAGRLLLVLLALSVGACATRPPEGFTRGVALGLFGDAPRIDYARQLDEIRGLGADTVSLVFTLFVRDYRGSELYAWPGFTPTEDEIARWTSEARRRGLHVTIFPIVRLERRAPWQWRGLLRPASEDAFFASYERLILGYARAAARAGADRFVVGSELVSLERREDRWRPLIARVRAVFPGKLLYSANWDRFEHVPFWDALDEAGVSAYFELASPPPSPSSESTTSDERATAPTGGVGPSHRPPRSDVDGMVAAWRPIRDRLAAFRRRVQRPLVFTEIGYPSQEGAAARPWDEHRGAPVDEEEQRRAFVAFALAFSFPGPVDGAYVWIWFDVGGRGDGSYTPRGKAAAIVIRDFYRSALSLPSPR